ELSYNQNYNGNNYPHESPSFPCCDNCGGSHETFECQPMDQNIDFSGSDQIQTPQYPDVYPPSQEISEEVFQAKGDLMKSIQIFLEKFNCIPFEEKPKILLQAWYKLFAIRHAKPEDSNELFQKLLKDLKELAEYGNSPSKDHPIFNNDEEHSDQNKEYLENSSNEIAASNSNQEKEKPPQDSDIRKLIREECCVEVCEEQKQKMEDTILELVEICRQKELLCMHDNVDDLIESALNSKLLSIDSQHLNKEKQEVKNVMEQLAERRNRIIESLQNCRVIHKSSISLNNTSQTSLVHAIAPILSTKEPEYSTSMGDKHPNTTPETESDEIIKSGVEELVPILSENGGGDDDDFEDIEYVEASLSDPEIVSVAEENVVYQEEEEEKLINVVKNDIPDDSTNDPLLEEANLFLAFDNSMPPGIENFGDDSEGDIHFLKALLNDYSILLALKSRTRMPTSSTPGKSSFGLPSSYSSDTKSVSSSSGSGTLPGNTITNPKEELKGITTQSGVAYQGPKTPSPSKQGTEVPKDQVQTPSSQNTTPVQPLVIQSESQAPVSEPVVAPVSASMPNLKPSIPYPSRCDNEKRRDLANEQIEKFYEIFKDMSFEISFTDALILMPKFASTLKALIENKEKLSEMARTTMNVHCLAVILNKLPRKLGDPGKFLIPCEFPGMDECLALADLGASINHMPFSMWEALSLPELTPTCMTLELVNRLVSKPIDIAKDVSFKVGVFHFPADFVVVDFEPDPQVTLILGRCFLKTGRALIDVHKGELTLRNWNEAITYNLDQTVRYSANYNQMTVNKIDVIELACEEYSQEVLGFSNITASGTPTPHDDPIVSATSPTLTPFGDSDFLLFEEADAFLGLEDDPDSPKINPFYYDPEGYILLLEAILNSEPSPPFPNQEQNLPSLKEELKAYEVQTVKSSFFPPSKTTNLRNEIMRFQQRFDESFYEAWELFNDLLRACPHHGFSELHQLDTFYNALNVNDQDSLNSAAGTSSSTPAISSDVAELKDMVKALLLDKRTKPRSKYAEPMPKHLKSEPKSANSNGRFDGNDVQTVILNKLPRKLGDPSKFLIPCEFSEMDECLALTDLGASLNLMPLSVWDGLSLPELTPTYTTTSGNPTPIDDPVISTTSPTLTPFGDSDFLFFEEANAFLGLEDDLDAPKINPFYYDLEGDILLLEAILNSEPLPPLPNHEQYLPSYKKELKGDNKLPVIIAKELGDEEKSALLKVLKSHKRAIAWKLSDIQGINPEFCTHKILLEEDYKPVVQHQRRVNPKIHDVIKKEVEKLLDAGLIYLIFESPWVSPVHFVPKKGGFTVVENEENELILTRLVTEWRVCIDYRKLNEAT
nr:reverse transcriptase domain-containing protein [Tanacetum cinerariifolium]